MKEVLFVLLGLGLVGCVPYIESGSSDIDQSGETITSLDSLGAPESVKGQITGVWRVTNLQCSVQGENMMERDINEPFIKASKIVTLPDARINYQITSPPNNDVVVKLIRDQSRGLTDHYILLSESVDKPAYGAVVVTEVPENYGAPDKIFPVVQKMQEQNAGKPLDFYKSVTESTYGPTLEFIVPGRTSGLCFPTAPYAEGKETTVTISRFIVQRDRLIEFSLVLDVPENANRANVSESVRASMDEFWSGFSSL